jgi:hypothetical protein
MLKLLQQRIGVGTAAETEDPAGMQVKEQCGVRAKEKKITRKRKKEIR